MFVDPVADIAVLGQPDGQSLFAEAEAYDTLVESTAALSMGSPPSEKARSWLLSLDGTWNDCLVRSVGSAGNLWLEQAESGIVGGMSGSPILYAGKAIGVVCTAGGQPNTVLTEGGPEPCLKHHLPGWLLAQLD